MPVNEFDLPDRFVAGTVGPPGQRTFFLQASGGRRLSSVSCEKEQIAVLGERLNDLLDEFSGTPVEATVGTLPEDNEPLATPIEDEFRVVALSLAWDPERQVIVIECHDSDVEGAESESSEALGTSESSGSEGSERSAAATAEPAESSSLRVVVSPAQAREFARRCLALVAAGRPPCPFCGGPLDPTGHVCPRSNGYRR